MIRIELPLPPRELHPSARVRGEWSEAEVQAVREWYAEREGKPLELNALAQKLGRSRASVACKANALGVTNMRRTTTPPRQRMHPDEVHARRSAAAKKRMQEHGHPRGALGMRHTPEALAKIGAASRRSNAHRTEEQKREYADRANLTKVQRYGTAGPGAFKAENPYSRARGGRRADLGGRYFRSAWEANYARFLNFCQERGIIRGWEFEPKTFVFHGVTRGALTYTPDFLVHLADGSREWREVKGWMDSKSRTKLKRMAKHYPEERVVVVGASSYAEIRRTLSGAIPGWE